MCWAKNVPSFVVGLPAAATRVIHPNISPIPTPTTARHGRPARPVCFVSGIIRNTSTNSSTEMISTISCVSTRSGAWYTTYIATTVKPHDPRISTRTTRLWNIGNINADTQMMTPSNSPGQNSKRLPDAAVTGAHMPPSCSTAATNPPPSATNTATRYVLK